MQSQVEPIREAVVQALSLAIRQGGREAPSVILDAHRLADDLRLDSLDFAVVVVELERRLGVDPFRQSGVSIRTVGDLVQRYLMAGDA